MRNITILLSTCSLINSTLYAQTTDKPNIIMFLVDDMGWQDTSVPFLRTTEPCSMNATIHPTWKDWHKWEYDLRKPMHVQFPPLPAAV